MNPPSHIIDRPHPHRAGDAICLGSSSDVDLLEAWRRDHYGPALAAIVERYSVMVMSVCRRRCRTECDAEDAYQTTFLYLASHSHKIRRPECLAGWLQRVAQRASIATLSSSRRETEPMVEPPADPDDPLDRLTQRHEAIVLDEELAELPEHYRTAIVMQCYQDRSLQTLAEHFGTTVGSIRGRLQRGKQLLAQRLRRRGVVPVVAFAAAEAWQVSDAKATQAAQQFIESTSAGDLPDPPIDTPLLESLLFQGVQLMPALYTTLGLVGGTVLILATMTVDPRDSLSAQSDRGSQVMSIPAEQSVIEDAVIGQLTAAVSSDTQPQLAGTDGGTGSSDSSSDDAGGLGGGLGATQGAIPITASPFTQWTQRSVAPTPTNPIAREVMERLEEEVDLNVSTTLSGLPQVLASDLEIPVLIDERGMSFAKRGGNERVQFTGKRPLRTALRSILRPMGLKATVEAEGLVITADPSVLVHEGIGLNRWIDIDEDAERSISEKLGAEINVEFVEIPLQDIIRQLSDAHELPVVIDRRALEEIGLSSDEPISFSSSQISLRNFLDLALSELDLTYTIKGETMVITTTEASEQALVSRIYWLEGTGLAPTDFQSLIDTIQASIEPDTWEALGGPSTLVPLRSTRPGIVVNSTYTNHQPIERLLEAMRETHFGGEPVMEPVPVPSTRGLQGGMGGFGGGMGGMGGGGMGGMGGGGMF